MDIWHKLKRDTHYTSRMSCGACTQAAKLLKSIFNLIVGCADCCDAALGRVAGRPAGFCFEVSCCWACMADRSRLRWSGWVDELNCTRYCVAMSISFWSATSCSWRRSADDSWSLSWSISSETRRGTIIAKRPLPAKKKWTPTDLENVANYTWRWNYLIKKCVYTL